MQLEWRDEEQVSCMRPQSISVMDRALAIASAVLQPRSRPLARLLQFVRILKYKEGSHFDGCFKQFAASTWDAG